MRRQQGMRLDERYVPYLQMAGLYHLARLNDRWFQLDEPLVSAFVERWHPETIHSTWSAAGMPIRSAHPSGRRVPVGLFADKSGNHIHIIWLPFVARLEEMGGYSWGSAALAWLYRCMCRGANRHVVKLAGPLQLLQSWIFWRFPGFKSAGYDAFSWPLASRYHYRIVLFILI
ncbi:uncharacterized protein [Arachis hypogaea]|uniref:uncharacterized protein n=1 Tax=Arachis hypogaea TaxID=3818 RepID=UPI003B222D93